MYKEIQYWWLVMAYVLAAAAAVAVAAASLHPARSSALSDVLAVLAHGVLGQTTSGEVPPPPTAEAAASAAAADGRMRLLHKEVAAGIMVPTLTTLFVTYAGLDDSDRLFEAILFAGVVLVITGAFCAWPLLFLDPEDLHDWWLLPTLSIEVAPCITSCVLGAVLAIAMDDDDKGQCAKSTLAVGTVASIALAIAVPVANYLAG
jgi:hypothetical protein